MNKAIYSDNYRFLCEYLKNTRKRLGLRQGDLAEKIGRTRHLVGQYENGQRRIDIVEFYAICTALEIDPYSTLKKWEAMCVQGKMLK